MIGRIVRIIDRGEKAPPIVAVRFAELSESDQDTIIYSVFAAHFATVGLGDDDDFDQP